MAEWIRQMAIGHQNLPIAEQRCYANAAIRLSRAANFARVGVQVIGDDLAVGKTYTSLPMNGIETASAPLWPQEHSGFMQ